MPGSSPTGNNQILELIGDLDIATILDVGPGRGQWYDLLHPWFPDAKFDAIEIFEPYVERYRLRDRYNDVYVGDARIARNPRPDYDLVIFGDVLEHVLQNDAMAVVDYWLYQHALISIPLGVCPQRGTEENPYEEHVSTWYDRDMEQLFPQITRSIVAPQDPLMGDGIGRGLYLLER